MDVVTERISEVRPDGVVTADGVLHEVDTIILGTGFRITDPPLAPQIVGRDGQTLARLIGHPEHITDPRFASPAARRQHRGDLTRVLDDAMSQRTTAEWLDVLTGHLPVGPVYDVARAAQVLQLGPTTSLRSATTTVVVQDGESVAIGGLINDRWTDSSQGVPYLMDVPFIGDLFRFDDKMKEKVNLIILLTPRIVQNPAAMRALSDEQRHRFRSYVTGRAGRYGGTIGHVSPTRIRSNPAEKPGVLLPAVDLGEPPSGAS